MRPETKELYPANWQKISRKCIEESNYTCQDCRRSDSTSDIVLTTHHRDYDPSNNARDNLVCLCQGCHLRRQAKSLAAATKYHKTTLLVRMGQLSLPGFELAAPKIPARVLEGKALATHPIYDQYALQDT